MNREEFKRHFPNASEDVIRASCDPYSVASGPVVERDSRVKPVGEDEKKDSHQGRRLVRYTVFRVRAIDQENWCTKPFTDAFVAAGYLADDSPGKVRIEVVPAKAGCLAEQRTVIEIFEGE